MKSADWKSGVVASVPQLARGMVWCTVCGREQRVDAERALGRGWPKCCGYTMTIDSPAERAVAKHKAGTRAIIAAAVAAIRAGGTA